MILKKQSPLITWIKTIYGDLGVDVTLAGNDVLNGGAGEDTETQTVRNTLTGGADNFSGVYLKNERVYLAPTGYTHSDTQMH